MGHMRARPRDRSMPSSGASVRTHNPMQDAPGPPVPVGPPPCVTFRLVGGATPPPLGAMRIPLFCSARHISLGHS